jgi:Ca-activated chloride channel homolog
MRTSRWFLPLFTILLPAIARAQGIVIPGCPRPMPDRPIVECMPVRAQVVRTSSNVRVELRDRVLHYEVEERFVNRGGMIGEADYVFPLPNGAAFRDLKLSIDGQMVGGETLGADEARRVYEDIVRRQRDPALVEWMGHGLLRTRIFPFNAGEERRVVVRFESVAPREGDALRVDYFRGTAPTAPNPRLVPVDGGGLSRQQGRTTFTLTYQRAGELGDVYSPTHELDVDREGDTRHVSIREGGPDVTVLVALRRASSASITTLAHATRDEPGFALLTVTPPADLANNSTARDVTFVLDVSGSMNGPKLEQAKAAGHRLLHTLTSADRFRVIDFSTDVRSFRDDYVYATDANVRAAERYLDGLDAEGSTNISGALDRALEHGDDNRIGDRSRLPLVLFITDGEPTVGERDPDAIAARAARERGDARVFTFGLGSDVNVSLIEQLALQGRGTAQFVRPDESIEHAVELVASRLRQPVLSDVRITVDGDNVHLSRMYPTQPLDVFAGQDLVVLARYDGSGTANVVVQGRAGSRDVRWTASRNFPREEQENAFVPRLWATQRIGWLSAEKRRSGASQEIDDEIRRLGERFGIPTEFTSYLVQEPGRVAGRPVPMPMDQAMHGRAVGSAGAGAMSAPAAAPSVFEAARAASAQRAAKSMAAADALSDTSGETQRAGTHMFGRDGDRWVDTRYKSELKVYRVKAYSTSYFTLIQRIPDLREALTVGDHALVAGSGVAIEVVDDASELTSSEISSIVSKW